MKSTRSFPMGLATLALLAFTPLAVAAEETRPPASIDLTRGGPTFKSGDNSMTLSAYMQTRFIADDREGFDGDTNTMASGFGQEDGLTPSFDIARLRLILKGGMFRPWLKYTIAWEVTRTTGESDSKLMDGILEVDRNHWAVVKVGQYKVPFSLQETTSDQSLQFTERALTTNIFAPARDMGVALSGSPESKKWGYTTGVFNGSGQSKVQDDQGLLYTGRVWFHPLAEYKMNEGTTDMPEKAQLHLGAGVRTGEAIRGGVAGVVEDVNNQAGYNLEVAWKFKRWFATGEWFAQTTERANPSSLSDIDATGWHAQGAFMAIPKKFEIGLRRAEIDPDGDTNHDRTIESRLSLNWYIQAHNLKVMGDFGAVDYEANAPIATRGTRLASVTGETVTDKQARIQFQLFF